MADFTIPQRLAAATLLPVALEYIGEIIPLEKQQWLLQDLQMGSPKLGEFMTSADVKPVVELFIDTYMEFASKK